IHWIQSFISNCTIAFHIDASTSRTFPVSNVGIPQGSPLSPVLSTVYASPLL
ncbi:hypothetical protein WOLCODRAFT_43696, partial [Wolfiporia cocos MD-104 SS10]